MDIQQIKHKFKLGSMDLSEIEWLINTVEEQAKRIDSLDMTRRQLSAALNKSQVDCHQHSKEIEQYKLQETLLLGRLEKVTLEYKQLKKDRRLISFYEMAQENLKMAEELALLKGELSG